LVQVVYASDAPGSPEGTPTQSRSSADSLRLGQTHHLRAEGDVCEADHSLALTAVLEQNRLVRRPILLEMPIVFTGKSDAAWRRYGKVDPYFGVCNQDKYQRQNLNGDILEEFFQSGAEYINFILRVVREHVDGEFRPARALDFGCGVGRLTIPLAQVCSHVVGVDVSCHMLNEAQKNLHDRTTNVDLQIADDKLSNVSGTFDFVVSFMVFQHIPPQRGEAILKVIIDRLDTGGIGVLHFTYHRRAPRIKHAVQWTRKYVPFANNFVNLLQKKPFLYPLMQWNNYNLNSILLLLQEQNCGHSYIRFTDHGEHLGVILFFQKKTFPTL
jgi:SAM-dependent methyltransferase